MEKSCFFFPCLSLELYLSSSPFFSAQAISQKTLLSCSYLTGCIRAELIMQVLCKRSLKVVRLFAVVSLLSIDDDVLLNAKCPCTTAAGKYVRVYRRHIRIGVSGHTYTYDALSPELLGVIITIIIERSGSRIHHWPTSRTADSCCLARLRTTIRSYI